jgi:hypothetical protein
VETWNQGAHSWSGLRSHLTPRPGIRIRFHLGNSRRPCCRCDSSVLRCNRQNLQQHPSNGFCAWVGQPASARPHPDLGESCSFPGCDTAVVRHSTPHCEFTLCHCEAFHPACLFCLTWTSDPRPNPQNCFVFLFNSISWHLRLRFGRMVLYHLHVSIVTRLFLYRKGSYSPGAPPTIRATTILLLPNDRCCLA